MRRGGPTFKEVVNGTAKEVIRHKKTNHKPWIGERSRVISEKQRRLRVQADDERDTGIRAELRAARGITLQELHRSLNHDEN